MVDSSIVAISRQGNFNLQQARELLPILKKITHESRHKVDKLLNRLEAVPNRQSALIQELENEINRSIEDWHQKVKKLGGVPKGMWLIDFDSGDGYFCWKYPEDDICYWHSYTDGFSGRISLEEKNRREKNKSTPGNQEEDASL